MAEIRDTANAAADDLRRSPRRRCLDRIGLPGAQRAAQPARGDQGTSSPGGRRAWLRAGRRGAGAERPAQGSRRGGRPADALVLTSDGRLHRRGREPAVPRHDQPRDRDRGSAARLRLADQVRGRQRARHGKRILSLARKSDGLILHDRLLDPAELDRLSRQIPIVTLAGVPTGTTANVRGDNQAGMRQLARHLTIDHGYRTIAYISGHTDSPDSLARHEALAVRGDRGRRHVP